MLLLKFIVRLADSDTGACMANISTDLFKKIQRIQIQTRKLANDILAGAYRSAFKGKGMEFEEVREYQAGDEIRCIDWNVTARMGHPYIKSFREEREISVILVVDVSSSSMFGSTGLLKSEIIAEIGAVIAFSAIKNNDKIGLILFSDIIEKYLPPKKGLRHVLRVIRELLVFKPKSRGTNLSHALSFLGKVQAKSGVCFLISDFLCSDYSHEIALIAQKHDLISICVSDPYELGFPTMNLMNLTDLETGQSYVLDSSSATLQNNFTKVATVRLKEHESLMKQAGADFIDIRTDQPYLSALRKFFKIRERKRR